ncbi:MAG: glycosyltransferase [Anaerolineae bacterium]
MDNGNRIGKNNVHISIIIPTLNKNVDGLRKALLAQTWPPDEVVVIRGVRPAGRARELGVSLTRGDILLFVDDDAYPGGGNLVEQLVRPLLADPTIGVTGAARILPAGVSWFQRRIAAEIPRVVNVVPDASLETNPPLGGYGHSLITTTCCAMRRAVYQQAGGFCPDLPTGEDTDLFHRIRRLGYRFVLAPKVWVEHPAPDNLGCLLRKYFAYGIGYGQETRRRPEQRMGMRLDTPLRRAAFLLAASLWVVPNMVVLYSYSYPRWEVGFRPLKALSTYAVAWGYVKGWREETL